MATSSTTAADRWKSYSSQDKDIVLVDGVRTPFMVSGTNFAVSEINVVELAQRAFVELHNRTGIPKEMIQYIVMGTVISEVQASNVGML